MGSMDEAIKETVRDKDFKKLNIKEYASRKKQVGGNHYKNFKIQPVEFITLNNLTFLEGKRRKKLFTKYKPCDIIFLSDRVRFAEGHIEPVEEKDQTGGMMAYMWIVWRKNSEHTNLHWASLKENYPEWREQYEKNAK